METIEKLAAYSNSLLSVVENDYFAHPKVVRQQFPGEVGTFMICQCHHHHHHHLEFV